MTENALDEFVATVRSTWVRDRELERYLPLDKIVSFGWQDERRRSEVLQDPRYIQYCKEQDRKEAKGRRILDARDRGMENSASFQVSEIEQDRKEAEDAQAAIDEGNFVSFEEIKGTVGLERFWEH